MSFSLTQLKDAHDTLKGKESLKRCKGESCCHCLKNFLTFLVSFLFCKEIGASLTAGFAKPTEGKSHTLIHFVPSRAERKRGSLRLHLTFPSFEGQEDVGEEALSYPIIFHYVQKHFFHNYCLKQQNTYVAIYKFWKVQPK